MKKTAVWLIVTANLTGFCAQISSAASVGSKMYVSQSTIITQNRNTITGFIFNESRAPISDVYVELLSDLYTTISRTRTNGSGLFSFRGLPDGNFKVRVIPYNSGYEEQTRDVALIAVSAVAGSGSASEQVDFYLKAKKIANGGPLGEPGVLFAQEVPIGAQKVYEEGINFLREKKEKEGFEKLKSALEIFPNYFLALDRLGTEYVVRGYYEAAMILLTKAVEVNPRSFSSTFGLGLSQFRLGQNDKAVSSLNQSIGLNSESVNAHLWLGIVLHNNGKLDESVIALLKANKLSKGELSEVHWQLARVYKDQKLYSKAAEELEFFLKYKPDASNKEEVKKTIQLLRQKENN